ncbi:unnamed protein product [Diplocarpon coronariae]
MCVSIYLDIPIKYSSTSGYSLSASTTITGNRDIPDLFYCRFPSFIYPSIRL